MRNSTFSVCLLEAPHHPNALFALVCLSNVLNIRQRLTLLSVASASIAGGRGVYDYS
jgi:hypothetical protein